MSYEIVNKNELDSNKLELYLNDDSTMCDLQKRVDQSEKIGKLQFQEFDDFEMIKWFLYQRRHLNQENDRSIRTIQEYQRELILFVNQLLSFSSEIDLDIDYIIEGSFFKSLQSRHLRRYQQWLATGSPHVLKHGSYSAATLERKTTIIRAFFRFLYESKYIKEPIYEGLRIASTRTDDRPNRDMGPMDVVACLDAFREINHPIMFTIVHVFTTTGIRNQEFCTLKVKDFKVDSIQGGYYLDVLGKGNKRRHVPLKEKVVRSIHMYRYARGVATINDANENDPLFPTSTGRAYSPSYLSQYVKKEIAGLSQLKLSDTSLIVTPHVFRHSFAIISKLNGVDIYGIMRSLGHEKIETTMIYLEKVFEKERHAIHAWKPEMFGKYI